MTDKITVLSYNKNPYKFIKRSDLFVLSSLYEGFPIVVSECICLDAPFIGSFEAIPNEIFNNKQFIEKITYKNLNIAEDFTTDVKQDDIALANLIKESLVQREEIIQNTQQWKSRNSLSQQFSSYDKILSR